MNPVMNPAQWTTIGCGLVLAGLAAESFIAHRWHGAERPAPVDALTVLAFALPLTGLIMMGTMSV